jgi:hypothetical protein
LKKNWKGNAKGKIRRNLMVNEDAKGIGKIKAKDLLKNEE